MMKRPSPRANVIIAFVLAIGLGVSVTLIVLGSRDSSSKDAGPRTEDTGSNTGSSQVSQPPTATLPKTDGGAVSVSEMSGLVFPTDMVDYRSAENPNRQQIDIMFSAPPASVAKFLADSGLPKVTEERLILHGSPLWDLNPAGENTITSTQDSHKKVDRTVEIVTSKTDAAANVVVRLTLAPTA